MVQSTLTAVSSVLFTYKDLTLLTITLTTLKSHPRLVIFQDSHISISLLLFFLVKSHLKFQNCPNCHPWIWVGTLICLQRKYLLQLKELSLTSLVGNLTGLKHLDLSGVNISSTVPNIVANLSTLRSLHLQTCEMRGEFPIGIFMLPNLRVLNVNDNKDLTGSLPDFQYWSSPLEEINLAVTSFSGKLPSSMGNLRSLIYLDLLDCNFSGNIPSSIGNLTNLMMLNLKNNSLAGNIPSSIGNLIQLAFVSFIIII
jgi:Leucine-rich repeat (LRR) protein